MEESRDQFINPGQIFRYIGEGKGIQGHRNSSYLDSTIFALFAVSDVFDSMFLEQLQDDPVGDVKNILWKRIVNPLRRYLYNVMYVLHQCKIAIDVPNFTCYSNGVVRFESIERLQTKLKELRGGKVEEIGKFVRINNPTLVCRDVSVRTCMCTVLCVWLMMCEF